MNVPQHPDWVPTNESARIRKHTTDSKKSWRRQRGYKRVKSGAARWSPFQIEADRVFWAKYHK